MCLYASSQLGPVSTYVHEQFLCVELHIWSLSAFSHIFAAKLVWFTFSWEAFMGVIETEIIFHSHDNMQEKFKTVKNMTRKSWK